MRALPVAPRGRALHRAPAGGAGLAWSLGFLTITIDFAALLDAAGTEFGGRLLSQLQTIAMAAVLLTMALVLWWWAETDSSF